MKLPDKPSELIRVAIADMEAVEKTPGYVVDMTDWHNPQDDGKCAVCLAGSVMAQTLGVANDKLSNPGAFDNETYGKLMALDEFRKGNVSDGLGYMGLRQEEKQVTDYTDSPDQFKADMRKMADELEGAGL